jgi:hypothetical protein
VTLTQTSLLVSLLKLIDKVPTPAPPKVFQLCLEHQLRDLQRVLDASPEELWAQAARKLFQGAIHLRNRFLSGEMTLRGFSRRVTQIENKLDSLLEDELKNETARRLQNRFSTHRDKSGQGRP